MNSNLLLLGLVGLAGMVIAIRGLFRPFLGLIVLMSLHFLQPGELVPALAPLRIEFVYGILILCVALRRKGPEITQLLKTDKIVRATILLEAVIVLTIPFAVWKGGAFESVLEFSKMLILQFLIILLLDSKERLAMTFWFMVGLMMWFTGTTLSAYLSGDFYVVNGVQRAQGLNSMVGDPNALAGFLVALLPFSLELAAISRRYLVKIFLALCALMTLVMLLFTGARIALIAIFGMILLYIIRSQHKIRVIAICAVLAVFVWSFLPDQYKTRYLTVKQYAEGEQLDDSNKARLAVWDAGWRMLEDHPVLGVGAGQFAVAYGTLYVKQQGKAWFQPHNLFLQVACELGVVGLLAFSYFLFQVAKGIKQVLDSRGEPSFSLDYHFAEACLFMMVGIGIVSTVSHTLYRPYWYMLAGLVSANQAIYTKLKASQTKKAVKNSPDGLRGAGWKAKRVIPKRHDRVPSYGRSLVRWKT